MTTSQQKFFVEKIVGKDIVNGIIVYRVKWENYPSSQNTWESVDHLQGYENLIEEYESQILGNSYKPKVVTSPSNTTTTQVKSKADEVEKNIVSSCSSSSEDYAAKTEKKAEKKKKKSNSDKKPDKDKNSDKKSEKKLEKKQEKSNKDSKEVKHSNSANTNDNSRKQSSKDKTSTNIKSEYTTKNEDKSTNENEDDDDNYPSDPLFSDIPETIIGCKYGGDKLYFKIKWKVRENGGEIDDSWVENNLLKYRYPFLCLEYYEKKIKVKK